MRIQLLKPHRRNGFLHKPGTILEADPHTTAFLVGRHAARIIPQPEPEKNQPPTHGKTTDQPNP